MMGRHAKERLDWKQCSGLHDNSKRQEELEAGDSVGVSFRDLAMHCVHSSLPDCVVTPVNMIYEILQVRWNRTCLQLLNSYESDCIVVAVCNG